METNINHTDKKASEIRASFIEGCKKRDQKIQLQVYKMYYKSIYNICLRIVNDPMVAEEIMQESFLSAFEDIDSYNGNENFGEWLNSYIKYST